MSTTTDDTWLAAQSLRLAELTADYRGARYLQALLLGLTRLLRTRFAMVVLRHGTQGQVIALADGEDMQRPYRYALDRLPCRTVLDGEPVAMHCNVMEFFPGATEIEAYVGHPLRDRDDQVIGLLAVHHTESLAHTPEIARLLRVLAGRVAAEIEAEPALRHFAQLA